MAEEMTRSVDLNKVVQRMSSRLAAAQHQIALLEVALEDTVEQATELHEENVKLKREMLKSTGEKEPEPPAKK